MQAIAAVFASTTGAGRAINELRRFIPERRLNYFSPGRAQAIEAEVPSTKDMPPVGGAIGGALGGAAGLALGMGVGLLIPGLGPITMAGAAAAALFGLGGAAAGGAAGNAADKAAWEGMPIDELYVYKDALAQGKTVLIVLADDQAQAREVEQRLKATGAESVNAAHESWVVGMRDAEKVPYPPTDVAVSERRHPTAELKR